jgi:DNA polymerase-4
MASDFNKPDGLCRVSVGKEIAFIDAVGLKKLWGVGKVTQQLLAKHHITTTQELRTYSEQALQTLFGRSMGHFLYLACRGIDPGIFKEEAKSHSISTEKQLSSRMVTTSQVLDADALVDEPRNHVPSLEEKQMGRNGRFETAVSRLHHIDGTDNTAIDHLQPEQIFQFAKMLLLQELE